MATGGASAFFSLIEQLQTQPEPAYCGLTTLVIILNALAVDPRQPWKGPWRWYDESKLNCCIDLEEAKATGITFGKFACLARCQGVDVRAFYGSDSKIQEFRQVVKEACTSSVPTSFLAVSYTRKVLGQTGSGHFSPIGAYDEVSDNVLILDTARFKYGPHWVPLDLLFEAMIPEDPDTGKSRGYQILSYNGNEYEITKPDTCHRCKSPLPLSVLFGSKQNDSLRKEYKNYVAGMQPGIKLSSVISFWTKDRTNDNHVWELVQPQLQPVNSVEIAMVKSLRLLLKGLIAKESFDTSLLLTPQRGKSKSQTSEESSCARGFCCDLAAKKSSVRSLEISSGEALYVVFLASLPKQKRRSIVFEEGADVELKIDVDDTVKEQLLAEAALISFALETCDWDV